MSKKLYRVDYMYEDMDEDGQVSLNPGVLFIGGETELEAVSDLKGVEFMIREATREEVEAYVTGYDDGYDTAIIHERIEPEIRKRISESSVAEED